MANRALLGWVSSFIAIMGAICEPAVGSEAAAAAPPDLQEIVVTAQRRAENLQDVPISVQVVGSEALASQNLNSLAAMTETVPSVHVAANGRANELYIRGIGSGAQQSFDQSVGMFIDGIYHGRSRTTAATFLDVDRVEILKGPQSTFFGNNAIAGAFNIVTKQPTETFDAAVRALYGQDGQYAAEGELGGPLTQTLSGRVAMTLNGTDGWLENVNTGMNVPRERNEAARASFLFRPRDEIDATLKIEGSHNRNEGVRPTQVVNCPPPAPFVAAGFCNIIISRGQPTGLDANQNAESSGELTSLNTLEDVLTVNWRQGSHVVTSVSGFYHYDYDLNLDVDGTELNLLNVKAPEHYRQFSQELRLASRVDQPVEYLAGLYFQTDKLAFRQDSNYFFLNAALGRVPPIAPYLPLGQETRFTQLERTYSGFGSVTWHAAERLKLSVGLRVSEVKKSYDWDLYYGTATQTYGGIVPLPAPVARLPAAFGLGTPGTLAGDRGDHAWMPSARVQYQIVPTVMGYVSYVRGFKTGGFNGADNTGVAANLPFAPEYVNAYEAGVKSQSPEAKWRFNFDVFRSDYNDLQVASSQITTGGALLSVVRNAAKARSQGAELEAQWVVGHGLRLSAQATYLDSYYGLFVEKCG